MTIALARAALVFPLFCGLLISQTHAALKIEKVLPFATDREVRVQVVITSAQPRPVQLEGKITAADAAQPSPLWEGPLGSLDVRGTSATFEKTITGLQPKLWSPHSPALYHLAVTAKQGADTASMEPLRFGFRSISTKDGQVLLNGRPIFLRGIAINPPGRDIPDEVGFSKKFATDYVRYLRSQNVNMIRMNFTFTSDPRQQAWFDACDELGMMVYQGNYGGPPGGGKSRGPAIDPEEQPNLFGSKDPTTTRTAKTAPPEDFEASVSAYKQVFETYARHPSVVVYILSNELPGPVLSSPEWHDYLVKVDERINQWDPTRLVLGNAGYGLGREGDINDVHRYWGWYYNSFLTYYNLRDSVGLYGAETDKLPLTFSECVGSFTSPLGSFNLIFKKQLAPQLGWTGHSAEQVRDATAYQSFMVKRALESFRTMRRQNHRLAGIMPFTILFYNWEAISSFDEMKPKPAMEQMGVSYSPVLVSIENWRSQVYADKPLRDVRVHVVNDADDGSALNGAKLKLQLVAPGGKAAWSNSVELPSIPYFDAQVFPIQIDVPADAAGDFILKAAIEREGKIVSSNSEPLYVAQPLKPPTASKPVAVYDPRGDTINALQKLGITTTQIQNLETIPATEKNLIIGEHALTEQTSSRKLTDFISNGGRVLCLAQKAEQFDPSWLSADIRMLTGTATDPTYTPQTRPTRDQQNINPQRPWHPVFKGIDRNRMRLWSDYSGWDQSKLGFPKVFPVTSGFKLNRDADLRNVAVLANYDRGLEGIAIAEIFDGTGSVILTGLDLVPRAGLDPVSDQMLHNLVDYLTSTDHERLPLVEKPILWGDYPTERGVLAGPVQGLAYNCRWAPPPTAPDAVPLPDNTGAWNMRPGNPFVARGIRPFGPYSWSTGASPRQNSKSAIGTGIFHCRVPANRKFVVTTVENTQPQPQGMSVSVNEHSAHEEVIPPGKTLKIRTPITPGETDLAVRYTGHKELVILETAFE